MTTRHLKRRVLLEATAVVVVVLVAAAVLVVSMPKPGLRVLEWTHGDHFFTHYPPNRMTHFGFSVTVTNDGDSVGNGTIRCEVRQENQTYYGTRDITLSPGSTMTLGVDVVICANLPWLDLKVKLYRH